MRSSDWSSDVCSSDLRQQRRLAGRGLGEVGDVVDHRLGAGQAVLVDEHVHPRAAGLAVALEVVAVEQRQRTAVLVEHLEHAHVRVVDRDVLRSEEHTSELQSLMRISYAVFCLKKKKNKHITDR